MSVTQYIGARYMPLFAEPAEWDSSRAYEPLTIVLYKGNSYTSKQSVPIGASIDDSVYWAETGNYNAQVEQYRIEVKQVRKHVDDSIKQVNDSLNQTTATVNAKLEKTVSDVNAKLAQTESDVDEKLAQTESDVDAKLAQTVTEFDAKIANTANTVYKGYRSVPAGTMNAMLKCAYTYTQACKDGLLVYGNGTGANQRPGTISCSTFIRCLLLGIPFGDYLPGAEATLSRSGWTDTYGYRYQHKEDLFYRDPELNQFATARVLYDKMVERGYLIETDYKVKDACPGDLVFLGEEGQGTESIGHVAMVIMRTQGYVYYIDASSTHESGVAIEVNRGRGFNEALFKGMCRPYMSDAVCELANGQCTVTPTEFRAPFNNTLFNAVLVEFDVDNPSTITGQTCAVQIGDYTFTNLMSGRFRAFLPVNPRSTAMGGKIVNAKKVKMSVVHSPYAELTPPIYSGDDAFLIEKVADGTIGDTIIADGCANMPTGIYSMTVVKRGNIKTAMAVLYRGSEAKVYHADWDNDVTPTEFVKMNF